MTGRVRAAERTASGLGAVRARPLAAPGTVLAPPQVSAGPGADRTRVRGLATSGVGAVRAQVLTAPGAVRGLLAVGRRVAA
ncbi:hypothetical protein Asi02nite_27910 [Asanoa siamensis]|uniref:Uncharacterized protein n=1 Tax=Asanoa siamensis TaxID=926357 RepID=A0ABQ4CPP5_9ACTN|nr:hypothetical protein Asi02nite_27910 [Asanoa siamensis]